MDERQGGLKKTDRACNDCNFFSSDRYYIIRDNGGNPHSPAFFRKTSCIAHVGMAAREKTYEDIASAFRQGHFKPLYFFYGNEPFLIQELQDILLEHALAPHERDFNLDIVYGPDADAQHVLALCASYPVMSERRVVIVRDFDKLKDNRLFKEYAERPNPAAVVVLACGSKPDRSRHPYRALRARAVAMESKPLYSNQAPAWIKRRAKKQGYEITQEAAQMLVDYTGTDLGGVVREMEKLGTYIGERKTVSADDIVRASGHSRGFNVFELQKAIGERRSEDAFRIMERMLQRASNERGEAIMIVSVLNAWFMKLWKLSACRTAMSRQEIARHIGVSPFFVKDYQASLRRYGTPAIRNAFAVLLATDYELKGGSARSERLVMTLMLRKILSPAL